MMNGRMKDPSMEMEVDLLLDQLWEHRMTKEFLMTQASPNN